MTATSVRISYRYQPEAGQQEPTGSVRFSDTYIYRSAEYPYPGIAADILAAAVAQHSPAYDHNPWGPGYLPIDEYPEGEHELRPDRETLDRVTLGWHHTAQSDDAFDAGLACLKVWRLTDDQLVERLEQVEAQPD